MRMASSRRNNSLLQETLTRNAEASVQSRRGSRDALSLSEPGHSSKRRSPRLHPYTLKAGEVSTQPNCSIEATRNGQESFISEPGSVGRRRSSRVNKIGEDSSFVSDPGADSFRKQTLKNFKKMASNWTPRSGLEGILPSQEEIVSGKAFLETPVRFFPEGKKTSTPKGPAAGPVRKPLSQSQLQEPSLDLNESTQSRVLLRRQTRTEKFPQRASKFSNIQPSRAGQSSQLQSENQLEELSLDLNESTQSQVVLHRPTRTGKSFPNASKYSNIRPTEEAQSPQSQSENQLEEPSLNMTDTTESQPVLRRQTKARKSLPRASKFSNIQPTEGARKSMNQFPSINPMDTPSFDVSEGTENQPVLGRQTRAKKSPFNPSPKPGKYASIQPTDPKRKSLSQTMSHTHLEEPSLDMTDTTEARPFLRRQTRSRNPLSNSIQGSSKFSSVQPTEVLLDASNRSREDQGKAIVQVQSPQLSRESIQPATATAKTSITIDREQLEPSVNHSASAQHEEEPSIALNDTAPSRQLLKRKAKVSNEDYSLENRHKSRKFDSIQPSQPQDLSRDESTEQPGLSSANPSAGVSHMNELPLQPNDRFRNRSQQNNSHQSHEVSGEDDADNVNLSVQSEDTAAPVTPNVVLSKRAIKRSINFSNIQPTSPNNLCHSNAAEPRAAASSSSHVIQNSLQDSMAQFGERLHPSSVDHTSLNIDDEIPVAHSTALNQSRRNSAIIDTHKLAPIANLTQALVDMKYEGKNMAASSSRVDDDSVFKVPAPPAPMRKQKPPEERLFKSAYTKKEFMCWSPGSSQLSSESTTELIAISDWFERKCLKKLERKVLGRNSASAGGGRVELRHIRELIGDFDLLPESTVHNETSFYNTILDVMRADEADELIDILKCNGTQEHTLNRDPWGFKTKKNRTTNNETK